MYSVSDLPPRLAGKIRIDDTTGCWRWTAGHFQISDYGCCWWRGKVRSMHRVAYELLVGPIPDGLQLDHVWARGCRFRDCCRPDHLEPVTARENALRSPITQQSVNLAKTHCPQGHPYSGENLVIKAGNRRVCRTCRNEATRTVPNKNEKQNAYRAANRDLVNEKQRAYYARKKVQQAF